jgi:hypothetical protein
MSTNSSDPLPTNSDSTKPNFVIPGSEKTFLIYYKELDTGQEVIIDLAFGDNLEEALEEFNQQFSADSATLQSVFRLWSRLKKAYYEGKLRAGETTIHICEITERRTAVIDHEGLHLKRDKPEA